MQKCYANVGNAKRRGSFRVLVLSLEELGFTLLFPSCLSFLSEVQDPCGLGWCSINPISGLQGLEHLSDPFLW